MGKRLFQGNGERRMEEMINPSDWMLAKPWCRLFLAAFGLNLVVVAVLCDSRVNGCCPA